MQASGGDPGRRSKKLSKRLSTTQKARKSAGIVRATSGYHGDIGASYEGTIKGSTLLSAGRVSESRPANNITVVMDQEGNLDEQHYQTVTSDQSHD